MGPSFLSSVYEIDRLAAGSHAFFSGTGFGGNPGDPGSPTATEGAIVEGAVVGDAVVGDAVVGNAVVGNAVEAKIGAAVATPGVLVVGARVDSTRVSVGVGEATRACGVGVATTMREERAGDSWKWRGGGRGRIKENDQSLIQWRTKWATAEGEWWWMPT